MRLSQAAENPHSRLNQARCTAARVGPKPASCMMWWIWSRPAENGERPSCRRRTISTRQSITGIGSIHSASTGITGCSGVWVRRKLTQAITSPSIALPALPRNTLARGRHGRRMFHSRKPASAPTSTDSRSARSAFPE